MPIHDIEDLFRNPQYAAQPRRVTHGTVVPTAQGAARRAHRKRNAKPNTLVKQELLHDFTPHPVFSTDNEAVLEAARCLKCADAPCQAGCPASVDIKAFITCIQSRNWYGAAQAILTANPCGATCGTLCMAESQLCGSACNLVNTNGNTTHSGAIQIAALQDYALRRYAQMKVAARVDPQQVMVVHHSKTKPAHKISIEYQDEKESESKVSTVTTPNHQPPHDDSHTRIALIGAGPSSLSCATILARMGYRDLNMFERQPAGGGLGTLEIPQFRLPHNAVAWELQQLLELKCDSDDNGSDENDNNKKSAVTMVYGQELGRDFTISSLLKSENSISERECEEKKEHDNDHNKFDVVFVGIGKMKAKTIDVFQGLTVAQGYYHSKNLLSQVARATKQGLANAMVNPNNNDHPNNNDQCQLPQLHGRALVLGGGDVAMDCARTALRCGAQRVTLCLRRNVTQFRAADEERSAALREQVDVIPYALPKKVILTTANGDDDDKVITAMELFKTEQDEHGRYSIDDDQFVRVKCDVIISAFGSDMEDGMKETLAPVALNQWDTEILPVNDYGQTSHPRVFAGGDIIGSDTQVAAANDGKAAAWGIHQFLQQLPPETVPTVPRYSTEIDDVDISVEVCGVHFPNPFGLASAPPTTSCEMMARAFAQGWGFAVTKTFTNDAEMINNVSPRIFSPLQGPAKDSHYQEGFINIELVSDKSAEYWCTGIRELKRRFPDRVVVASIMSGFVKEQWQSLTKMSCEAGADMIEMNLSCPHGMHEKGMGLALGVYPEKVKEACSWVVEASSVPVFAKLTPNVTDITVIAKAARDAGVSGVTAINTVSGLTGFHTDSTPGRHGVGKHKDMTYGGLCGNTVRPLAFKGVSSIAKAIPGIPIMATGGIDSADVTCQMMYAGASVVQICSAVMNQDYTIIHDLVSGLKSILYMQGREDLKQWDHGMPPKELLHLEARAKFGELELERRQANAAKRKEVKLIVKPLPPDLSGNEENEEIPTGKPLMVNDLIGLGLDHIKTFSELPNREQVVAYVDPDMCLNCGKCYSACNDNGYQAITFNLETHTPVVDNDKCTGCGLCESVCPALNCISLEPRDGFLAPVRFKRDLQ